MAATQAEPQQNDVNRDIVHQDQSQLSVNSSFQNGTDNGNIRSVLGADIVGNKGKKPAQNNVSVDMSQYRQETGPPLNNSEQNVNSAEDSGKISNSDKSFTHNSEQSASEVNFGKGPPDGQNMPGYGLPFPQRSNYMHPDSGNPMHMPGGDPMHHQANSYGHYNPNMRHPYGGAKPLPVPTRPPSGGPIPSSGFPPQQRFNIGQSISPPTGPTPTLNQLLQTNSVHRYQNSYGDYSMPKSGEQPQGNMPPYNQNWPPPRGPMGPYPSPQQPAPGYRNQPTPSGGGGGGGGGRGYGSGSPGVGPYPPPPAASPSSHQQYQPYRHPSYQMGGGPNNGSVYPGGGVGGPGGPDGRSGTWSPGPQQQGPPQQQQQQQGPPQQQQQQQGPPVQQGPPQQQQQGPPQQQMPPQQQQGGPQHEPPSSSPHPSSHQPYPGTPRGAEQSPTPNAHVLEPGELSGQNSNDSSSREGLGGGGGGGGGSVGGGGGPGTPNSSSGMRPTPSPTGSTGSRSMSPAVGQQNLSMPPRPSSGQSDSGNGPTRMSHSPMGNQGGGYPVGPGGMGGPGGMVGGGGGGPGGGGVPPPHLHNYKMVGAGGPLGGGPHPGMGGHPVPPQSQQIPPYSQQPPPGQHPQYPQQGGYGVRGGGGPPGMGGMGGYGGQQQQQQQGGGYSGQQQSGPPGGGGSQQGYPPPPQRVVSNHVPQYPPSPYQHKVGYGGGGMPPSPGSYNSHGTAMGPPPASSSHHPGMPPPPPPTAAASSSTAAPPGGGTPAPLHPAEQQLHDSALLNTPSGGGGGVLTGGGGGGGPPGGLSTSVTSIITTGPDGASLDDASQQSTLSNASAASGEDSNVTTPSKQPRLKSEGVGGGGGGGGVGGGGMLGYHSHPATPGSTAAPSPGTASLNSMHEEYPSDHSPTWPRTPASPVFNSHVPQDLYRPKKHDSLGKLYEMDESHERRLWLDKLLHFMEDKGTPISACPTISKNPLDLFRLYLLVRERGGFMEVTKNKIWKDIAGALGIGASSSAAYTLRKHYTKNLLPYECHFDRGGIDPGPIISQVEATSKKKGAKGTAPVPSPGMFSSNSGENTVYLGKDGSSNSQDSFQGPLNSGNTSMDGYSSYPGYPPPQDYNSQQQRPPSQSNQGLPGSDNVNISNPFEDLAPPSRLSSSSLRSSSGMGGGGGPGGYPGSGGGYPGYPGSDSYPPPPQSYPQQYPPPRVMYPPYPPESDRGYSGVTNSSGTGGSSGGPPGGGSGPVVVGGQQVPGVGGPPGPTVSGPPQQSVGMGSSGGQDYGGGRGYPGGGYVAPPRGYPGGSGSPSAGTPPAAPSSGQSTPGGGGGGPGGGGGGGPGGGGGGAAGPGYPAGPSDYYRPDSSGYYPGGAPGAGGPPKTMPPPAPQPRRHPDFVKDAPPQPHYPSYPQQRPNMYPGWSNNSSGGYPRGGGYGATSPGPGPQAGWGQGPPVRPGGVPPPVGHQAAGSPQWQPPYPPAQQGQGGWGMGSPGVPANAGMRPQMPPGGGGMRPGYRPDVRGPVQPGVKGPGMGPGGGYGPSSMPAVKRELVFPIDSVEATTPVLYKRRRLTKTDVTPLEAWRLMMALKSGLLAETTWALDVLNILLFDDSTIAYFGLTHLPGLMDILLEHMKRALSDMLEPSDDKVEEKELKHEDLGAVLTPPNSDEKTTFLKSSDYTYRSRKGRPVTIEPGHDDIFVSDDKRSWDSDDLADDSEHDSKYIVGCFRADFGRIPFTRMLPGPNKEKKVEVKEEPKDDISQQVVEDKKPERKPPERTAKKKTKSLSDVLSRIKKEVVPEPPATTEEPTPLKVPEIKQEPMDEEEKQQAPPHPPPQEMLEIIIKNENDDKLSCRIRDPAGTLKRRRISDYEDECYTRDEASLYLVTESQDSIARRCVCISTILRNLTFVPGNEVEFAKSGTFLGLLGKLLLLHHEHPPRAAKQRNYDREEDLDFGDSCSSLQADSDWWWEFLHHLRENALVSIANIAGHVDLGLYPEDISRPILDGLLHWAVCPAAQGQDPFPTVALSSALSPQRLALEALCKLCVTDSNVDLVIATPPYCRLERLAAVLSRLLCRSEEQVLREFAVNLLYYLGAADSGMARTIATQPACISQLVAFIEQAEASAVSVANQHGLSALRDNPDSMGTSLDMLRRAGRTLLHLSQHPANRTLFLQQEQRLLALVMSQILDQQVASVISMVLYHISSSSSTSSGSSRSPADAPQTPPLQTQPSQPQSSSAAEVEPDAETPPPPPPPAAPLSPPPQS